MNSMLTVTVVLVLLILIFVLVFRNSQIENFRIGRCEFKETGESKLDCLNKCKSNFHCFHYQCEDICNYCEENKTQCPWDKSDIILKLTKDKKPQPVEISVETTEGSAKISFNTSRYKAYKIEGYLYNLYKTHKKSEGVEMGLFGNKNCTTCEKVITGLDPKETYTVSVKAFNTNGMGEESNKVNFVPIGRLSNFDFNINTPIEDMFENEYKFCDSN